MLAFLRFHNISYRWGKVHLKYLKDAELCIQQHWWKIKRGCHLTMKTHEIVILLKILCSIYKKKQAKHKACLPQAITKLGAFSKDSLCRNKVENFGDTKREKQWVSKEQSNWCDKWSENIWVLLTFFTFSHEF
jgi:hypothetical protein